MAVSKKLTDDASVSAALATIGSAEGRLDVLVHNAGILGNDVLSGLTALRVFDTNAVGIVRVTEAVLPLLRKSSNPTVVSTPRPIRASSSTRWSPAPRPPT